MSLRRLGPNKKVHALVFNDHIAHGSVETCEATQPFDLVDEPMESLYGRETDRDLRSACRCVR